MRKLKIVFGLNDFLVGGMQRQFVEQAALFDRQRFEVILITLFEFPGKETLYYELPADIAVYRYHFRNFRDIRSWRATARLLRDLKPDVVVSSLFFSNTVFRVLKPFVGYVSIAREHNTYIHKTIAERLLDRMLAPLSWCIVAVSKTVADFTARQERIPRKKFVVIRNGIDSDKMQAALQALPSREKLKEGLGFKQDEMVLLNVARLTPQKNHGLLIDGFALFARRHPHSRLAVVGGGALLEPLRERAKRTGVGEAVVLFGHQEDMPKFYKIADALVSTSDIEGLSNAHLEALAAGLPLVSTLTAGTDEILVDGHNGFVIKKSTPEEVAYALERAISADPAVLKKHASQTAERFSLRETVAQYQELFEKALL